MANDYKILGQLSCAATAEEAVYTVPANHAAVISTVVVCNRTASSVTFRLYVTQGGGSSGNKDYLYYDVTLPGNDSFVATLGITLAATDKLRFYCSAASCSVNAFGNELDV